MRTVLALLMLLSAVGVRAAEPTDKPDSAVDDGSLAKQLKVLEVEYQARVAKLEEQYQQTTDADERTKLRKAGEDLERDWMNRAFKIVSQQPTATGALDLLEQISLQVDEAIAKGARDLIAQHHADKPAMASFCFDLIDAGVTAEGLEDLLKAIREKNPDRKAQAAATLAQGVILKARLDRPGKLKDADREKLLAAAEQALSDASTKYADVTLPTPMDKVKTVADQAKRELYVLRNFSIGKTAPDIVGEDSSGRSFKLSDSRGKVVMLEFWADWCGPCMTLIPHERGLVKKYAGQPFAIVGVNASESKEVQRKTETDKEMTWASFHDGESGPIAEAWNIQFFPTIYVLDQNGVIRYKNVRGEELDEAIDKLVGAVKP